MLQICKHCEHALREDDEVLATVVARYHELGSTRAYSITKPTECIEVVHRNCQFVKGLPEGD